MNKIIAKFNSKCAETGKTLEKGTTIYHDPVAKKAYHADSNKAKEWEANPENRSTASFVQAQEDAYYDNNKPY